MAPRSDRFGHTTPSELHVGIALSRLGKVTRRATARSFGPTRGQLDVFCGALLATTGLEVVPHGVSYYDDLLYMLAQGDLDLAWLPPIVALQAVSRGSAEAIAVPVRVGGAVYYSALFSAPDSHVTGLEQLSGTRVAWVDTHSSAGYQVIRAALRADGFPVRDLFAEERFCDSHEEVVRSVLSGDADVGATYAHYDDHGRLRGAGWKRHPVNVLKAAGPIPSDVLAASTSMPANLIEMVRAALVDSGHAEVKRAADDLFDATGFVAASNTHFDYLRQLVSYLDEAGGD